VTAAAEAPVGPVAGTKEYSREYQRRRARGLPTKGLAQILRNGIDPDDLANVPTSLRRAAEYLLAAGHPTSLIMAETGLTYRNVYELRENLR
jgi:hypothetical protein